MSLPLNSGLGEVSDIWDIYLMCLTDLPDIGECRGQVSDRSDIYLKCQTDVPDIVPLSWTGIQHIRLISEVSAIS
jgi:hypothetical protein